MRAKVKVKVAEEDSGKVDPETGLPVYRPVHTGRKRPRVVEADWPATTPCSPAKGIEMSTRVCQGL